MEAKKLVFAREKETKNTFRYAEQPSDSQPPVADTLYIKKWAVGEDAPKQLVVTVTEQEPSDDESEE